MSFCSVFWLDNPQTHELAAGFSYGLGIPGIDSLILAEFNFKKHHAFPGLVDTEDHTYTNAVGVYLFDKGQKGLLAKSARCDDGVNIASFTPDILRNPVTIVTLHIDGRREHPK